MGPLRSDYLDVMGSAHLGWGPNGYILGAYREGSMTYNGDIAGPEGLLEVTSPARFQGELDVMGQARLGELSVDGSAHLVWGPNGPLLGAYREGASTYNGEPVGPEGLLEVASPATFQNDLRVMPEGTLSVDGTTTLTGPTNILGPISFGDEFQVSGTAQMDQLFVEGNLNVMGPVSFENGFQVGSNGPNGPMLGAYSEGSTTPNGNIAGPEGLLEVASPALFHNELHVMEHLSSWKAHFLELQADNLQVESPDGQILGAYTVGSTTFNGDEVGPEGLLEVISPATFQNNLDLTGPEGRLNVEGTTTLMGPTNILGPISFGDEFASGWHCAKMDQLRRRGTNRTVMGPAYLSRMAWK